MVLPGASESLPERVLKKELTAEAAGRSRSGRRCRLPEGRGPRPSDARGAGGKRGEEGGRAEFERRRSDASRRTGREPGTPAVAHGKEKKKKWTVRRQT